MRVWYHPLFNDTIVTVNPRYIIPLNEDVWVLGVGCWVYVQPLIFRKTTTLQNNPQTSSFQVASLSDEHSLLKKFSEFQKRGKERLQRFLNQPLLFRKTQPFETIIKHPRSKWQVYRTNIRV
jgi:hypothetical protein